MAKNAVPIYETAVAIAAGHKLKVFLNHGVDRGNLLIISLPGGTPKGVYINPADCPADKQQEHQP
jgi:hypothetical protein